MKKVFQFIALLMAFGLIAIIILFFPLPQTTTWHVDDSVLLEYHRVGGFAGFSDTIKVLKNGSVVFNDGRNTITTTLSDQELDIMTEFVQAGTYTQKTQPLIDRLRDPECCDMMYTYYLINENGKTVSIHEEETLADIMQHIGRTARQMIYNGISKNKT